MVKKKGNSKRTALKDKYKIQRRVSETHRKRQKQSKKDRQAGKVIPCKKDPGIPNSWPFKQDLLKEIQHTRERQQALQNEAKEKRKQELSILRQHQAQGGTAKTVQELIERASQDQAQFHVTAAADKSANASSSSDIKNRSDGTIAAGQPSRRAYLRELRKVVDAADVLLQVLDARDPIGSRIHPAMEEAILSEADKRMVLVLNKIDLVPKQVVSDWLAVLRRSHPTIAIKASASGNSSSNVDGNSSVSINATSSSVPVGMDGLLQLLKNYSRTGGVGGKNKTTISVGILGYPNVGKSSIINALKRTRAVGVSSRPGSTASMQEVVLDRNVRLLDSPGVVFSDDISSLLRSVDEHSIDDPIPPVEAILRRCDHASLLMIYNIPSFAPGNVMVFLAMVAKSYGRVLKGGIPDKVAAARTVLRDWKNGKIPYYTPAPNDTSMDGADSNAVNAVIVSQMSEEFSVEKFDEDVIRSLKDRDELDFVKINGIPRGISLVESMDVSAVKFLKGEPDGNDEQTDEQSDKSAMESKGDRAIRANAEDVEDYDFDEM